MFEKEAEEYATENWEYYEEGKNDSKELKQAYQQGAEFGYNKANEWHYVKDREYPERNMRVLALLENKQMKISIFMENAFTIWNKDYGTYTKLYNVVAWKEITPPKEVKENEN